MSVPALHDPELDALTEVCNIGMGHAANALSRMMGKAIGIQVPRLQIVEPSRMAELLGAQEVICLRLEIVGEVRGSILVVLEQENARCILELLLGGRPAEGEPLSELELATLNEVGNIVASACLNAFGAMLKMPLLPSIPSLVVGDVRVVLPQIMEHAGRGEAMVMIQTVFSIDNTRCGGSIFLLPESDSLESILRAVGAR